MYPEYNKVSEFLGFAKNLDSTSKRMQDIYHLSIERNAKEVACIFVNENGKLKNYKYKKVRKNILGYAAVINSFLAEKEHNKPVVLKMANSPKWVETFWAILMNGFKPLLIDARTAKEGTQNLINQSKAVAIITDDVYEYTVDKITVSDLVNRLDSVGDNFTPNWEDEVIFCSSGTTGDVKLMIYNGANMCAQIQESLEMAEVTKDLMYPKSMGKINILAMIPFHHIFGFVAVFLWFTFYGKALVYPSSISPTEIQKICQKAKVSHIFSVPLFWDSTAQGLERKMALEPEDKQELVRNLVSYNTNKISKEEAGKAAMPIVSKIIRNKLLGSAVRYCISGGGYLNNRTASMINGINYPLYNGFGMTEVGVTSVELSPSVDQRLKGSIGKPLHGVSYKIKPNGDDPHVGELFIKSNAIHVREIIGGVEKETTFDEEGYFPTGDIAEVDYEGSYYIKGRIKDIIINADGENIFPDELEIFFKKIPNVKNLCVLGVKAENSTNEDVVLAIEVDNAVTDEDIKKIEEEIKEIGKDLPKGTKIARVYLSRNKLPLANNMKVKRFVIKKEIEAGSSNYIVLGAKKEAKKFKGFDKETIENILEPMRDLFSEVLILPKFKIDDSAHWINDLGGDSMNYVELVLKVQEKFKVTIPESQYGQLTCVNDFVEEVATLQKKK